MKTLRVTVRGRVQGVFFRDSMRREAQRLGVTGWVRNRSDGAVESVIQGAPADVDALVRWTHRGPDRAEVAQVDLELADGVYADFRILY